MSLMSAKKLLIGGLGGLDLDARALIARMTTKPSQKRQALISRTIFDLKRTGAWAKADAIYLFAAHEPQAAMLNWRQDQFNCVPFYFRGGGGARLRFVTDKSVETFRVSGTGSTDPGVAIDTQLFRAASGVKMQALSAQFAWIGENSGGGEMDVGSNDGSSFLLSGSNVSFGLFGSGSGDYAISNSARSNRLLGVWREQGNQGLNIDGSNVKVDPDTPSSNSSPNLSHSFLIAGTKNGYSANGLHRAAYFGARLSSNEDLALADILGRYLREIGAIT